MQSACNLLKPHPQQILEKIDCHYAIAATHASQVVALDVGPHVEVIDHQTGQAGRGAED